jgi:xanthine/CO dehydrogenase XdhC/CoxF family maturation factor
MECLTEIFRKPYAYVGMMGSKKRAAIVKKDLEESGFSQENISGLHSPIGLAIGGQTPEEIALSVISEIVKCKNERTGCTQVDNEVLDALIEASDEKYILCTIIKKNGSAPRGVGTQMLVSSDNRIIGTIGGGCAEAEVISHCRRLFRKQEFKCGLMDVSMNTDDAEKEGMVCGGRGYKPLQETVSQAGVQMRPDGCEHEH